MLTYRTAGESHGKAAVTLIEGFPAGVRVDVKGINAELARRQGGYGRGGRMKIETDTVEFLSGVRRGLTLGGPVVLVVANRDARIDDLKRTPRVFHPRPGHGDLAGALKYLDADMRNILERASARETAARVAAGAFVRSLLKEVSISVFGHVVSVGGIRATARPATSAWLRVRSKSPLYSLDARADKEMIAAIDAARGAGDTLGGVVEVAAFDVPPGLGSHVAADRRLDARLAAALMGIQAIKGVEVGLGFEAADLPGSQVHDDIGFDAKLKHSAALGYTRGTNNAGGIEAGISNGQPIVVRAAMKPIATLGRPLPSVDIRTKKAHRAAHERSDVCAVPAASVVAENVVAFELAAALLEKTGGDTLKEVAANLQSYLKMARDI
ncbi:MAG: chorismate synthase [Planctomycetes bacterium]|nr:chorismate synthase [Planctomycetota bacterium]